MSALAVYSEMLVVRKQARLTAAELGATPLVAVTATTLVAIIKGQGFAKKVFGEAPDVIRLAGLAIEGRLLLQNLATASAVQFDHCDLRQGIDLRSARLQGLQLTNCVVGSSDLPVPSVDLRDADLLGSIDVIGGRIAAGAVPAIDGTGSRVGGDVLIGGGDRLRDHPQADGCRVHSEEAADGSVKFVFAEVGASAWVSGADIRNSAGPALNVSGSRIGRHLRVAESAKLAGSGPVGTFQAVAAEVRGDLVLEDCDIDGHDGPAANLRGISIGNNVYLMRGLVARGGGVRGAVRLNRAVVAGHVRIDGAEIIAGEGRGPALDCERVAVGGGYSTGSQGGLRSRLSCAGPAGSLRLTGANIGGECELVDLVLENSEGPLLAGSDATFGGGLILGRVEHSVGGDRGAFRLGRSHVEGLMTVDRSLIDSAVNGGSGRALRPLWAVDGLTYQGYPEIVELDEISGSTRVAYRASLPSRESHSDRSFSDWLTLLSAGSVQYAAQPFQHLASVARDAGHEQEARRAIKEQRGARERSGNLGRRGWALSRLSGLTVGYGFDLWRPLLGLMVNVAVAVTLLSTFFAGDVEPRLELARLEGIEGRSEVTVALTQAGTCGPPDYLLLGLEIGLPLVGFAVEGDCQVADDPSLALALSNLILQGVGWATASLFVAGFSGIVRRA